MASSPEKENVKRRLRSEYKARRNVGTILEWIVSFAGLVLGIVSIVWSDTIETLVLLVLIAMDVIFVFALGVKTQVGKGITETEKQLERIEHEDIVAALKSEIESVEQSLEKEKAKALEMIKAKDELEKTLLTQIEILSRYELRALNSLNEIMIEWIDETSRIRDYEQSKIVQKNINEEDRVFIQKSLQKETERMRNTFFARHRQFLGRVVDAVQQCAESHLRVRGKEYEVSVAVKLFLFPSTDKDLMMRCEERNIFTGFRDQRSWNNNRQQTCPTPVFSVAGNTDFNFCLRNKTAYIFNNMSKSTTYENESGSFPAYYNCGATSCIAGPFINEMDVQWCYGFIACDVKNQTEDYKPIDDVIGSLVELVAHLLGIYYDRLEDVWVTLNTYTTLQNNYYTEFPSLENAVELPNDSIDENGVLGDTRSLEEKEASFFYNYYRYVDGQREWPGGSTTTV